MRTRLRPVSTRRGCGVEVQGRRRRLRWRAGSKVPIYLTPVAHRQKMEDVGGVVEGIDDPVIANAQPVAVSAGQPMVGKGCEPQSHLVYPGLDARPYRRRELEKRGVETRVINLKGRAHRPRQGLRTRGRRPAAISRSDSWTAASKSSVNSSRSSRSEERRVGEECRSRRSPY